MFSCILVLILGYGVFVMLLVGINWVIVLVNGKVVIFMLCVGYIV